MAVVDTVYVPGTDGFRGPSPRVFAVLVNIYNIGRDTVAGIDGIDGVTGVDKSKDRQLAGHIVGHSVQPVVGRPITCSSQQQLRARLLF